MHFIFTLCTGFQSTLESNTQFLLFVSVLLHLPALSTILICSRSTHLLGNFDILQTALCCAFHLLTLSCVVNTLILLQLSGKHFQKSSAFLSAFLSQSFRSALKTHMALFRERERESVCVCVCV